MFGIKVYLNKDRNPSFFYNVWIWSNIYLIAVDDYYSNPVMCHATDFPMVRCCYRVCLVIWN
jgi:hypothetical protein